jgi:leukotriene-A4 hydrolase
MAKPHLGQKLSIELPKAFPVHSTVTVSIDYETTQGCTALQWLPPTQTAGKVYPYLFSQSQAIHARSLFPCMDSPSVKITYKAKVTVPSWSTAIMSALSCGSTTTTEDNTTTTFLFHQPIPIPSYLFAIVVGQLECRSISPRVKVWSEPSMVDAAADEFANTEEYLSIAEEITGIPYVWGRYDLLCLVPSFPYGGMENPCLTFVTPTLLAGDGSLTGVIAHEIAHSWTGNLVTNATWEHFWLNEGWTRWLESKIMTKYNNNNSQISHLDMISANVHLKEDIDLLPPPYTRLVQQLGDNDPDDSFSSVPYEKGFQLLYFLEQTVGEQAFLTFFQSYLQKFKYGTITSQQFQDFFSSMFESIKDTIPWDTWYYEPGMPIVQPSFDDTLARAATELANEWVEVDDKIYASGEVVQPEGDEESIRNWKTNQISWFLDDLFMICTKRGRPLQRETIALMSNKYRFHESKNSEILFRYSKLAVAAGDDQILPTVIRFITTQGRMKYVRPLYRALFESTTSATTKSLAVEAFLAHKNFYHPIAAKMIAKDLELDDDKGKRKISSTLEVEKEKWDFIVRTSLVTTGIVAVVALVLARALKRR